MKISMHSTSKKLSAAVAALFTVLAMSAPAVTLPASGPRDWPVPAGTSMRIRVQTEIRSTKVSAGDPFQAVVSAPVQVSGNEVIPQGTLVIGSVASVEQARAWGSPSGVVIRIMSLRSQTGVDVGVDGELTDDRGNRLSTVENLTAGTELMFRLSRGIAIPDEFMGQDGSDYFEDRATIMQVQDILQDLGYYTGRMDGTLNRPTRQAISAFQRDQRLSPTGFLDRDTLARLGVINTGNQQAIAVTAISADASTTQRGELNVRIVTRNTANLALAADHFRQRDTLHIFVRGFKVQFVTRPSNEIIVKFEREQWQGITRIVVHSAGNDVVISSNEVGGTGGPLTAAQAAQLERELTTALGTYARSIGVKYVPFTGQLIFTRANYRENEIELLFAFNALSSNARLYSQLLRNSSDRQAIAGATDLMVQQAKLVDRALARTQSNNARILERTWVELRDEFASMAQGGDVNVSDAFRE